MLGRVQKTRPFRSLMPQKDFPVQRQKFPVFRAKFPVRGEQGISLQVLESYMHSTGPVPSPEAKLIFPVNFPVSKIGPGSESLPQRTERPRHAPKRAPSILGHRGPPAVATAGWAEIGRLAGAGAGGVGPDAPHGAHGDFAAPGSADAAGHSKLDLARIRHARRFLAHQTHARCAQDRADGYAERPSLSDISRGRASLYRGRLGTQCAWLRSGANAQA